MGCTLLLLLSGLLCAGCGEAFATPGSEVTDDGGANTQTSEPRWQAASPPPTGSASQGFAQLVDSEDWRWLAAEDDPTDASDHGDLVRCGPQDARVESGGLELSTTGCNYATLAQPLPHDLAQGSQLRLLVWWQTLASDTPARGHLELALEGATVWQREVNIPGPADVADATIELDRNYQAGTQLMFHLRNHGYNTWNLNRIDWQAP